MKNNVYLHVSNSGFTIGIEDEGFGPTIVMVSSAFGNIKNINKVYTNKKSLKKIGEMFLSAAEEEYTSEYIHSAQYSDPNIEFVENKE